MEYPFSPVKRISSDKALPKKSDKDFLENRILVLAPIGKDASLIRTILEEAELDVFICRDGTQLTIELERGAGTAILADEALDHFLLRALAEILVRQAPWSDPPLIVTTLPRRIHSGNIHMLRTLEQLRNVTFLERPVKVMTMVSTVRSALAARRRQYQVRDLLEKEKLASRLKDEFLATLSHELRTPLNVILGYAEILREEVAGGQTFSEALDAIHRNAKTQSALISDLLDVSRIITGKIFLNEEIVDLRQVIDASIESLSLAAKAKRIMLQRSQLDQAALLRGDPTRLQQIVWNLLSNAIKFSKNGGSISLRLEQGADKIVFEVQDYGEGIDQHFLPYVFDRFRQQDGSMTRHHGGLGLGLSIVRHLSEAHGGSVSARSPGQGRGSTFQLQLPRLRESLWPLSSLQLDLDIKESAPTAAETKGGVILIVDDQVDNRLLLRTMLGRLNIQVIEASSAAEAEAILKERAVDAMICDISMPGESGLAFVARWRQSSQGQTRHLPIAALSAYASTHDRDRALAAGFDLHVAKPIQLASLTETVEKLLEQARGIEESQNK